MDQDTIVHRLVAQAVQLGADAIVVEYKDRREEVVAMRGPIGFGIASFRSADAEAEALRRELYRMVKRRTTIAVGEVLYDVRVHVYDSFGEDAFHVEFKQAAERPNRAAAGDSHRGGIR
ncbi:MAG: hypothetical protein A3G24_21630 [Betaproteobacteria bacterium RIFCSPLOWO2_12_FULL_62_13]|nr:MAG: hypothetical protein A3G24_21630 [Betaproteobacteria bacterium RIFCSPLOWO2_12_FULL_62_13]